MANRYTRQFTAANIPGVNHIFAQVAIGAAGAPTIQTGGSYITAMVRNSAGDYTLTLADSWYSLLNVCAVFDSGASAPASPLVNVRTNAVGTKSLRLTFRTGAGTATDPASGEVMYLDLMLKNSSVTY